MLFVANEEDAIIPASLVKRNAEAYTDPTGIANFRIFPGRGHFICGEPGWQEVAGHVEQWVQLQSPALIGRGDA